MAEKYSWIPFYTAFADKLLAYRQNRRELLDKIQKVYTSIGKEVQKLEEDNTLQDIDPFTLFGFFNKGITDANRMAIINGLIKEFDISANAPDNFNGIPVLNNLKANFFGFKKDRTDNDIDNLWELFSAAITLADSNTEENRNYFCKCYDKVHDQICIKWNITMGLYWIRPYRFLSLDSVNRNYVGKKKKLNDELSAHMLSIKNLPYGNEYMNLCDECISVFNSEVSEIKSFPELTYYAWIESKNNVSEKSNIKGKNIRCWFVGAYDDNNNTHQDDEFIKKGIWQNGYTDKFLDTVNSVQIGDKIAIKTSYTKKNGLPFDNKGETISAMNIKAVGTVTSNHMDGRTLEIDYDNSFQPKEWYFYTFRNTITLPKENDWRTKALIDFVFHNIPQDYEKFQNITEKNDINDKISSNAEFLKYFAPLIQALKDLGGSAKRKDVHRKVIEIMNIPDDELNLTYKKQVKIE